MPYRPNKITYGPLCRPTGYKMPDFMERMIKEQMDKQLCVEYNSFLTVNQILSDTQRMHSVKMNKTS